MTPVLIFAKAPVAGKVKTRLLPILDANTAAAFHQTLVESTLLRLKGFSCQLWCAPDPHHSFFRHCREQFGIPLFAQGSGDLGEKMQQALETTLSHHERALLIGSDCPGLTAEYIQQAMDGLEDSPAVITPTEDGGFCLIGLRGTFPSGLFDGIDWGSDRVMEQLRQNLRQRQQSWQELPKLWDIDRPEDYLRYCRR
ncbi:MAG: glycosyltransferase [Gammaproteobacteria bacterium]|nr:MAG: glycosyltransferase [Gammaproteobacteria bacterium]